jgi:hypothetical protein
MHVSDEFINELFEGTNFGKSINNSAGLKRKQMVKTLMDQVAGYWSGHTAYNLAVHGGFLIDSKSGSIKQLTEFGVAFLKSEAQSAAEQCRLATGLTLAEAARRIGKSRRALYDWHRDSPDRFAAALKEAKDVHID